MTYQDDIVKTQIFIDIRSSSAFTQGYGVVQSSTKTLGVRPEFDFYINVNLNQTFEIHEYVDTQIDRNIKQIPRQEINPYFLEYEFFDDITKNKVNNGEDLNSIQLNFIRSVRFDVSFFSDNELKNWFDARGKNELPWVNALGDETSIYDIEKAQINLVNIISKAEVLKIAINR